MPEYGVYTPNSRGLPQRTTDGQTTRDRDLVLVDTCNAIREYTAKSVDQMSTILLFSTI